jgi:hypothetical protein
MNYVGMQADILEVFVDAARARRPPSVRHMLYASDMSRARKAASEAESTLNLRAKERRGVTLLRCAACGGWLEQRIGCRVPQHVGQCPARTLAADTFRRDFGPEAMAAKRLARAERIRAKLAEKLGAGWLASLAVTYRT